jgi:adenine-specific DNA-methyltransferase
MAKKKNTTTKIAAIRHKDKRTNIPTEELRDFVVEEELAPKSVLYPRDTSLDPQLVWKGKDEQDRDDLAVPVVPIYIQEKIHPKAIIDALPRVEPPDNDQPNLFADFNGGPTEFAQKVEFYHHEQNWSNRLILGDSLLVMTSLAQKEGLKGKVQAIYIDPPYGIKFGSNWQVSTRKRDVKDGKAEDATRQPEQVRAFRDTWKLGIHSYLAYLRDRLVVGRDLLTDTGSVFVQIGDQNVHLVRNIMDEVFGSENFQAQISFKSTNPLGSKGLPKAYDYVIWYAKSAPDVKFRPLFMDRDITDDREYRFLDDPASPVGYRRISDEGFQNLESKGKVFRRRDLTSSGFTPSCTFEFKFAGVLCKPFGGKSWATNPDGIERLKDAQRIFLIGETPYFKRYFDDAPIMQVDNCWTDQPGATEQIYVVQTAPKFIQRCLLMTTDPGDLVFDPTCGSGSTAYVAEQWGRRWITCDTSRVALALARTRLMAAKYPYYLLADSPEGIKKETELTGKIPHEHKTECDVRKAFVYKRVPHVTLRSIANNPDIKKGMTREQIDAAISRHADTETLYDQPYEDSKRVRVCGPFSVESLSPHRVLSTADENQNGTMTEQKARKQQDFVAMILDNLRKAGVQNTRKGERLVFDRLDPYSGVWLHAAGEYTDATKQTRRVVVSIGPEHGTVGPQQVKEAAKEAVQGVGFDTLVVCGFAFDPHVAEETKRYGKLIVLPAKMNPDLSMGDELLKKTGAGNLFMVFGEPDVDIRKQDDGKIVVEVKGVDVYDPTTGQIRSASTDDIACWFIDTDYNGESFFVRLAYFTGADEPYEKLKQALRADIDEAAWSSLHSTVSRPFAKPESGKFAVKVINHYGDEVLKVFAV